MSGEISSVWRQIGSGLQAGPKSVPSLCVIFLFKVTYRLDEAYVRYSCSESSLFLRRFEYISISYLFIETNFFILLINTFFSFSESIFDGDFFVAYSVLPRGPCSVSLGAEQIE